MENIPDCNLPEKVPLDRRNGKSHKGSENLRPPWRKGECPNPEGKTGPKWKTIFGKFLAEIDPDDPDDLARMECLIRDTYIKARKGHPTAMNIIFDRIDPAPKQNITINNNIPAPVVDSLRRIGIESQEGANA